MIELGAFLPVVRSAIPRFQQYPPNADQVNCVESSPDFPLMILAGPGSGKTTVLVLRALRLVFVDGLMPENILITTFTRKAADEIRSRLIEWGTALIEYLASEGGLSGEARSKLDQVDISRFVTGTLDAICEDTLTTFRDPGDSPPILVEGFVGNALLARKAMLPQGAHTDVELPVYLAQFTLDQSPPRNFGERLAICRILIDRIIQDRVDLAGFGGGTPHQNARALVASYLTAYRAFMDESSRMDFAGLEEVFLSRLSQGRLQRFTTSIKAILVDEYQDTNPLQEAIYFELVRQTSASISVVGDDDQSLYRFRGATVELFCDFPARLVASLGQATVSMRYLTDNYRSTPEIVAYLNRFISCDPTFTPARVQPPKPQIVARVPSVGLPVIGMFRGDAHTLAHDLALFLHDTFRGSGAIVPGYSQSIRRNLDGGDLADAAFLAHSVNEVKPSSGTTAPASRLPKLLRQELHGRGIGVFNPRGQALRDIESVRRIMGLMLEAIDPPIDGRVEGRIQLSMHLTAEATKYMNEWRSEARTFVASNPLPSQPHSLSAFISAWQSRTVLGSAGQWPQEWPLLELCYKLVTWIPFLQDDPEGQVYLEAISRCISQAGTFSSYRGTILSGNVLHDDKSVQSAIRDVILPLAESSIEVDEEIVPHVPRSRLPMLTIHQAKGLEFPLVIVDVASDFTMNHPKQRFRRYPESPNGTQRMEDDLAPYSQIGPLRLQRPALARSFDDIVRLHYVAFSRPQSVLLLVGIDKCLSFNTSIRHVATGWRADGVWDWRSPVAGTPPVIANNVPLTLI